MSNLINFPIKDKDGDALSMWPCVYCESISFSIFSNGEVACKACNGLAGHHSVTHKGFNDESEKNDSVNQLLKGNKRAVEFNKGAALRKLTVESDAVLDELYNNPAVIADGTALAALEKLTNSINDYVDAVVAAENLKE